MGAARSERPAMYHLDNVWSYVCGGDVGDINLRQSQAEHTEEKNGP